GGYVSGCVASISARTRRSVLAAEWNAKPPRIEAPAYQIVRPTRSVETARGQLGHTCRAHAVSRMPQPAVSRYWLYGAEKTRAVGAWASANPASRPHQARERRIGRTRTSASATIAASASTLMIGRACHHATSTIGTNGSPHGRQMYLFSAM